jgi:tetratricopeptide (TPR) repeat protein
MRLGNTLILMPAILAASAGCTPNQAQTPKESGHVVFRNADGRILTMGELNSATGTFRYEIVGDFNVPAEAKSLHQQAREAGGAGDYKKAIDLLGKASKLAPQWPYPVYDLAFTYLLMGEAENATEHYRKTIELAPRGFFTAITALDTLLREKKGALPAGTYLAFLSIEWADSREQAVMVRQLVERVPAFAPGWEKLAALIDDDAERLTAIEKGLAANPDAETRGSLQIAKALIMNRRGQHEGAVKLLGELALDPLSTYSTENLAKFTLANITKK